MTLSWCRWAAISATNKSYKVSSSMLKSAYSGVSFLVLFSGSLMAESFEAGSFLKCAHALRESAIAVTTNSLDRFKFFPLRRFAHYGA